METVKQISLGTEETYIGRQAMRMLRQKAPAAGKKALIVAGQKALESAIKVGLIKEMEAAQVPYVIFPFQGYCSETNVSAIQKLAFQENCDFFIGVGGGKCMDATKSAADRMEKRCILIPSSCATCASNVRLCVWYDDQGRCVPGMFAKHSAFALIVDTELIVTHGSERLMASGMMDALAKYPEIDYSLANTPKEQRTALLITAQSVAKSNFDYILNQGEQIYRDAAAHKNSFAVEQMAETNIVATGLASSLVAGVQQLAIAHMFHDAVATLFHDQRTKYLHGEVVAVGVLLQMHSNGYDSDLIQRTEEFIRSVHGPLCLSDLEIAPTQENRAKILEYIASRGYEEPAIFARIEEAFQYIER